MVICQDVVYNINSNKATSFPDRYSHIAANSTLMAKNCNKKQENFERH